MSRHPSKACIGCTQTCLLRCQQYKDPSPLVLRFFKILQNEEYSEILYLPPAFSKKVPYLVDQETDLEVSSGQRWTVTVSKFGDSLAFHKGWNEFFVNQSLTVGQFLEFHYLKGSHFLVRIYGRSGCEIINFNGRKDETGIDKREAAQDELNQKLGTVQDFPAGGKERRHPKRNARVQSCHTLDNANTRNKLSSSIREVEEESLREEESQIPNTADENGLINQGLVDVPIGFEENYNKIFPNLEDKINDITNKVSDIQKGEASNSVPGRKANNGNKKLMKRAAMEKEDAGSKLTMKKRCSYNFFSGKDNLDAGRNTEMATENRQ